MSFRVVVTGVGAISPLGNDWETVFSNLKLGKNCVQTMPGWDQYEGLNTQLGAPAKAFEIPAHFTRKAMRSMGRVALMATIATEKALADAGLLGDPIVQSGDLGIAYGSSSGSPAALASFGKLLEKKSTEDLDAGTYLRMMSHTAPVNMAVFFGITGRIVTTTSACTSGSQGVGYGYEAIKYGKQKLMLVGGAEELDVTGAAVFDTLFATSTKNTEPELSPCPFDANRDGLVLGEGACTLVLEELSHAQARGAKIYAELVGFGSNCDGSHITQPNAKTMGIAMQLALQDAQIDSSQIGYVNAHGTATAQGDVAETQATRNVFNRTVPISSLKSYMGHTLGACGGLEAWMSIQMMNHNWFAPTINLNDVDPACGELDYLRSNGREINTEFVMSNNFAFGGINTSLIFRRWK